MHGGWTGALSQLFLFVRVGPTPDGVVQQSLPRTQR